MANRKVLINLHSTRNEAPDIQAQSVFHGELVVSHPEGDSGLSATTIWTRNNNTMVPFASCAMTMQMIDNAISDADVTYDVKAAEGDAHVEVVSGGTEKAKVFTVSSKDVMSEDAFNAYSAATDATIKNNYNTLSGAIDDVLAIITTAITGDTIINVSPSESGAGTYSLTHKAGHASSGFNKLTTDAYGHVTSSTAVTTEDIQALGFKTSAETGEDLKALSASVVTNKTNIEALSAGTKHDIEALSGNVVEYVKVVSGNIETVINELSANTTAGDAAVFASAKTYTEEAIEGLDSSISTSSAGKYFTALAIENGKLVAKEEADIPVLSVESAGTGNVVASITVADHKITYQTASVATSEDIQKLSAATESFSAATDAKFTALSAYTEDVDSKVEALSAGTIQLSADTKATIEQLSAGTIMVSGYAHGEIVELSGAVQANETDIDNLSAATLALSAVTLTGVSLNNTPLTVSDHVVSVPVADDKSDIAGATATGNVADAKAVRDYVEDVLSSSVDYKGATASLPASGEKGDLYIASSAFTAGSKNVEVGDFIIYNGESWDVIEKNLDGAITGNLTAGTVTLGDSTNSVKSLANGSAGQVLTMVDGAPAWANDPELTVVSAGTGNVLTDITVDDHEITFTKGVTAANDADLKALSGVVEDFSAATDAKFTALSAYTKDVDDKVKALSAGTIQLSADTKAAIEQLSGFAHNSMIARDDAVFTSAKTYTDEKVAAEIALLDSVGSASTTGHYLTAITIEDGKITSVGEQQLPAATPVTTVQGTTGSTAAPVLVGVVTGGTEGHQLTLNYSNMVSSAMTSQSADVATNAVHASAATKVDSALTLTDVAGTNRVEFDGSANKTVTFGTATSISGENSMTMSNAGVVDVNIIDCGEY